VKGLGKDSGFVGLAEGGGSLPRGLLIWLWVAKRGKGGFYSLTCSKKKGAQWWGKTRIEPRRKKKEGKVMSVNNE